MYRNERNQMIPAIAVDGVVKLNKLLAGDDQERADNGQFGKGAGVKQGSGKAKSSGQKALNPQQAALLKSSIDDFTAQVTKSGGDISSPSNQASLKALTDHHIMRANHFSSPEAEYKAGRSFIDRNPLPKKK